VFDSADGYSKEWNAKAEPLTPVPESAWQQLAINLNCTPRQRRPSTDSTSLTPALAALELPKGPLVPELECVAIGRQEEFPQKMMEETQNQSIESYPQTLGDYSETIEEYPQTLADYATSQYPYGCGEGVGTSADIITIGVYTRTERAAKLQRYRQKRARRNFTKRVLYGCRKRFADSRPRVGGRFVINENRVIKPKTFLKRGRPRKVSLPLINYLAASCVFN